MDSEKLVLIREIEILRDENIHLKKRIKYANKFKNLANKMYPFLIFIQGSNSEKIAKTATNLCTEFREAKESRHEIFAD